jgi:choice-of-anchor A domain-containing protein
MKIVRKTIVLLLLVGQFLSPILSLADEIVNDIPSPGTVYDDLNGDYGILGIASKFHIFTKGTATLNAHTNGNVAAAVLNGHVNFGTNIHEGLVVREIDYIQSVSSIQSSTEIPETQMRKEKFVVGNGVEVTAVDNGTRYAINGTKLDHIDPEDIYQDPGDGKYIDFDQEFARLSEASDTLMGLPATVTVTSSDFSDPNNRVIDLSEITDDIIYVNIDADVLKGDTELYIKNPDEKVVVMNVVNSGESLTINSEINYNDRASQETEDFSDANISWNFGNDIQTINTTKRFEGTVLAPNAQLTAGANLDGSIITASVVINAESHRWDPIPIRPNIGNIDVGSVVLTKVDAANPAKALSGAVFDLQGVDGTLIQSGLTTDETGKLEVDNLSPGNYQFIERQAPVGYDLNATPVAFTIEEDQTEATEVTMENTLTSGGVVLSKTDAESGEGLQGAVFELQDSEGAVVQSGLTTDTAGELAVDGLAPGDYQLVETQAPAGYDLDSTPVTFTIEVGQTEAVQVAKTNTLTPGGVVLSKTDSESGEGLQGAVFELQDSEGTVVQSGLVTDTAGKLAVDGLEPGDYQLVETQAPTGYDLDATPVTFTIEKNQKEAVQVTKTNTLTPGGVVLSKTDSESGEALQGAVFELQDSEGVVLQSGLTTDAAGKLAIDGLEPDDYQLVETQAPSGYELDTTPVTFTIEVGQTEATEVTMTNTLTPGGVVLSKTDSESGEALQGAVFELQDSEGVVSQSGLATDATGKLAVDGLEPGDYQLVETQAPVGYDLDATPVTFTIEKDQKEAVQVTKTNTLTPGGVVLNKIDSESGEGLQGAVFELQDSEGTVVKSGLATDEAGKLAVDGLEPGDYQLVETQAPAGYDLDNTPVTFTIEEGQTEAVQVTKTNTLTPGGVVLSKTDAESGEGLQGAVFELQDSEGTVVQSGLVTDTAGKLAIDGLEPGDYQLVETQAPTGYDLDATPVTFTIEEGQTEAVQVSKTNTLTAGSVILSKIDSESGEGLQGAIFELQDKDGKAIQSDLATDEVGKLAVDGLEPGDYQLVETQRQQAMT